MFMSDPSQPSGAEPERARRAPQIKRGDSGETERVTNQTRCIAGQEGQSTLQIKPTLSAGWRVEQITPTPSHLPRVRVEESTGGGGEADAADIKQTERQRHENQNE